MERPTRLTIALLACAFLIPVPRALAQARDPDTAIKFNLSTPGARSLAMGGAFVGMADDATAAYTNPAGLTNLTVGGSEVAVEWRHLRFSNTFVNRGHFSAAPGVDPYITGRGIDQFGPGLQRSEADSEVSGLSFLSVAYVFPGGLTVALYRHELGNFETRFRTNGPFVDLPCEADEEAGPNGLCIARYLPRQTETRLDIINHGISAAYEFQLPPLRGLESTLSVGLGISFHDFEIFGFDQYFGHDRFLPGDFADLDHRQAGNFYGAPSFGPENLAFDSADSGQDDDWGVTLGFLWKLGREQRWSLGGVFRGGPRFESGRDLQRCNTVSALNSNDDPSDDVPNVPNPDITLSCELDDDPTPRRFTVPDVYGLGVAFRSAEGRTKITLDLNRVRYSQRLADFTLGLAKPDDADFDSQFDPDPGELSIEDADQVHLGVERIILVVESLAVGTVRFGAWREPFHDLEYLGDNEAIGAFIRRPEDAEIHFSLGFGLAIREDYQIDFAADLSDPTSTFSFSLVKFL